MSRRAALALLLAAPLAAGAQTVTQDGYEIHYAAFATSAVPAAMTQALGVQPRRGRAVVLVNARRLGPGGGAVACSGSGTAKSLTGHVEPLRLRPAAQPGLHDAVAEFEILDGEWLTLELQVTPTGAPRPIPVRFRQQFYLD